MGRVVDIRILVIRPEKWVEEGLIRNAVDKQSIDLFSSLSRRICAGTPGTLLAKVSYQTIVCG